MEAILPEVRVSELAIWDEDRELCCGYLNKRASKSSAFSKGKWQKRWFVIDIALGEKDNYSLRYFHKEDEKTPRQSFPLANCTVKMSGGTSFVIDFNYEDGSNITLNADSNEGMRAWIESLDRIIAVANLRDKIMREYETHSDSSALNEDGAGSTAGNRSKMKLKRRLGESGGTEGAERYSPDRSGGAGYLSNSQQSFSRSLTKHYPALRLDVDIETIPPSSTSRHQFLESFCKDITRALEIDEPDAHNLIEIISLRSAPGLDWLTLVEFDINLSTSIAFQDDEDDEEDYEDEGGSSYADGEKSDYSRASRRRKKSAQVLAEQRAAARETLLGNLYDLVVDPSSSLYNGFVTSKVDPTFTKNLADGDRGAGGGCAGGGEGIGGSDVPLDGTGRSLREHEVTAFSTDATVLAVMKKYERVQISPDFEDKTHFPIFISFEGRIRQFDVPNPQVLTNKRACAIWPHEIKQIMGFAGTMQERWIKPVALIPRDLPKTLSHPVRFAPSVRCGGEELINTSHLRPHVTYELECEDRRDEALNQLTKSEMEAIKETFQKYDINGDGGISKPELEELIRKRTQERKEIVEDKFFAFINEPDVSKEEISMAESNKAQYLQQLREAQAQLLAMFEAADLDGDGVISLTEFIMAEAWWLRCTLNPESAHLF